VVEDEAEGESEKVEHFEVLIFFLKSSKCSSKFAVFLSPHMTKLEPLEVGKIVITTSFIHSQVTFIPFLGSYSDINVIITTEKKDL